MRAAPIVGCAVCLAVLAGCGGGGAGSTGPTGPAGSTGDGIPTTGRHVDPVSGDDTADGSFATPWRTIGMAARSTRPGETVWIHGGTYRERIEVSVSGGDGAPITFQAVPGQQVTVTGDPSFDGNPLLHVRPGIHHLRFAGFSITGYQTAHVTYAVRVDSGAHHIELDGLRISRIDRGGTGAGLPIVVYGADQATPTHDVTIRRCEIFDSLCKPGQAITVMGNVDGFTIEGSSIHDVECIAVDVAGNYGTTVPTAPPAGWSYDPTKDRARNGIVRDNTIARSGAIGIYVDGGQDTRIERNSVDACVTGIEVAAEVHVGDGIGHAPDASGIRASGVTIRDNVVTRAGKGAQAGLAFVAGAWPDGSYGPVSGLVVTNNTFSAPSGVVQVNPRTTGLVFENNVVFGSADGSLFSDRAGLSAGNRFDHDLFFSTGQPRFTVEAGSYATFAAMAAATGREAHGRWGDPLFVSAAGGDHHLATGSPGIDAGDPSVVGAGEVDRDGVSRVCGAGVDIGAYER